MRIATLMFGASLSLVAGVHGCPVRVNDMGIRETGEACNEENPCAPGLTCFEGTCVGQGTLRVSLAWERRTDLDLHVVLPNGDEISWEDQDHPTGQLDVDDCIGNLCRDPDGPHVENIFFNTSALTGEYLVFVENFNGGRSTDFTVEVETEDGELLGAWSGSLPASAGANSPTWSFVYDP